jgi:hypothetical protein
MAQRLGTRTRQSFQKERIDQGAATRFLNRDHGLTKNVTASITFGSGNATGANGTFTGTFAAGDPVLVEGANLNNGYFIVTALDAVNAAYLTLDPPPKAEGPLTVTLRTP